MIKVTVYYPTTPGARFDHDYYRDRHMPLVAAKMGAHLDHYPIERGLGGAAPGDPPPFVAAGNMFCASLDAFQAGMGPHVAEIMADIPDYTDIAPVIQISELTVQPR